MSSEHFGQLAWQFKRVSGSSGLKVQAAIEHRGKTELPFDLAQDQHAAIRRQLSTIKRCSDRFSRPVTGRVETA